MNRFAKWLAAGLAAAAVAGSCWLFNARAGKVEIGETIPAAPTVAKVEQAAEPVKPQPTPAFVANDKIPLEPWLQFKLREIAKDSGVPLPIALGVIEQESRFTADAYNDGCYGYMQVSTVHAPAEILKNPVSNMRLGCGLLGMLYRKYKDWNKSLVVYNCGEAGAYRYYFQYGKYSSEYSRTVLLRAERWARELGERGAGE